MISIMPLSNQILCILFIVQTYVFLAKKIDTIKSLGNCDLNNLVQLVIISSKISTLDLSCLDSKKNK